MFYSVGKCLKENFDPGLLLRAEGPGFSLAKFELPSFHIEISENWQCKNSKCHIFRVFFLFPQLVH